MADGGRCLAKPPPSIFIEHWINKRIGVNMTNQEIISARLRELSTAAAKGDWGDFYMRIPAEPKHDADIVLAKAADLLDALQECIAWAVNEAGFYRCPVCEDIEIKPKHLKDSACPVAYVERLVA